MLTRSLFGEAIARCANCLMSSWVCFS